MSHVISRLATHVRAIHSSKNCESKKRSSRSVLPLGGSEAGPGPLAVARRWPSSRSSSPFRTPESGIGTDTLSEVLLGQLMPLSTGKAVATPQGSWIVGTVHWTAGLLAARPFFQQLRYLSGGSVEMQIAILLTIRCKDEPVCRVTTFRHVLATLQ